jgi:hypothetical protein
MKLYFIIPIIIIGCLLNLSAQETILVNIDDLFPRDLIVEGFELPQSAKIEINACGIHQESGKRKYILGTCWIISADSREVVWKFTPDSYKSRKSEPQTQKTEIELPSGIYEVYYASYPYLDIRYNWDDYEHREHGFFGNLFEWLFGDHRGRDGYWLTSADYDKFHITVKGTGKTLTRQQVLDNQEKIRQKSFISLPASWDEEYLFQGFEVLNPITLQIYAIGELREDGQYDYGWIVNTANRERVWEMKYRDTEYAGGAEKNRMIKEDLPLGPGKYAIYFVTDDSHSPRQWNSPPPYDPFLWGISINTDQNLSSLQKIDYNTLDEGREIVSMVRMRDDQYDSRGFSLKEPMQVQIYAIGEGHSGEMFDFGWIINANTREIVWQMTYRNTIQAGGASKNRLYDGMVELPAGNYLACYMTDGSHSYRHWNANPPQNPTYWGLTILLEEGEKNKNLVASYEDEADPNRLISITRVRNHEYIHENFSLNKESELRIYALGEGVRGEMYDYGWIEDSQTGKVVWEMTYRMTDYAGGAKKNRFYNDLVVLKPGDYRVVYETDDSHSYNNWNDAPPLDPTSWGIIVSKVR